MESGSKEKVERLLNLFKYAYESKQKTIPGKRNDEELYYADVEGTRSQFTQKQLNTIQARNNIPISTKIAFPIIQQMKAFLTGSQPYPRLIAPEQPYSGFSTHNERLIHALWYESDGNSAVGDAIEKMLAIGSGYIHVRENSFYDESSMGTIIEEVPWIDVFVDPAGRLSDLSDADFVIVAKPILLKKAEKSWGIKVDRNTLNDYLDVDPTSKGLEQPLDYTETVYGMNLSASLRQELKWVWERIFYEIDLFVEYVSPEGYSSRQLPREGVAQNVEKLQLLQQLDMAKQQLVQQGMQADESANAPVMEGANAAMSAEQTMQAQETNLQSKAAYAQIEAKMAEVMQMPNTIPGYYLKLENGSEVFVNEYAKKEFKRVKRTIMIEKQIVNEKILPTDVLPVIHFSFSQYKNPRNTFGIVHFIKDVQKALNKFWGLMIQDFQMRSALRMIVPNGAINDATKFEKAVSKPGAVLTYEADMNLPGGGKPEPLDMGQTSQMFPQIIALLVQLAEYITGIFGVMQGNSEGAPSTFGATQQLAGFGTQRIKLISRAIESPMSKLAYVLVRFLQWTVIPEKVVGLVCKDEEDATEFLEQFQQIGIDTKFKVRMQITSSLPTSTQMAANMFSILAGQVPDPQLQRLLIEYSVKFLELKEADEIISKMDIIKEMQSQLAQLQMANQNLEGQLKAASNNLAQKDIAMAAEKAKGDIQANAEIEKVKQSAEIQAQTAIATQEQPEEETETELF